MLSDIAGFKAGPDGETDFDFVICNGLLMGRFHLSNQEFDIFARNTISKLYSMCKVGVIFNLKSTYVDFFSEDIFYKNPLECLSFVFDNLTKKVILDHSYLDYEYFVTLLR